MTRIFDRLSIREQILAVVAVSVIAGFVLIRAAIVPAVWEWSSLRGDLRSQQIRLSELSKNLTLKGSVDAQFEQLGNKVLQEDSDEATLSEFLRDVERAARYPTLRIINMKPLAVRTEDTHKVYRIRLSVGGKLQEIIQFYSDLMRGSAAAGLESFSIRGVQGGNIVECGLAIWMVRLT